MSRKPVAIKFQKWIANVIKEIRLNNKYELESQIKDAIEKSENDNEFHLSISQDTTLVTAFFTTTDRTSAATNWSSMFVSTALISAEC
jgi:prophage antirepressor-like protein